MPVSPSEPEMDKTLPAGLDEDRTPCFSGNLFV
jgi:hypothetical protein